MLASSVFPLMECAKHEYSRRRSNRVLLLVHSWLLAKYQPSACPVLARSCKVPAEQFRRQILQGSCNFPKAQSLIRAAELVVGDAAFRRGSYAGRANSIPISLPLLLSNLPLTAATTDATLVRSWGKSCDCCERHTPETFATREKGCVP
jgi:hypothetical protein